MEKNLAKHSVKENFESVAPPLSFFFLNCNDCVRNVYVIVPVKVIFFCIVIVIAVVIFSCIWKIKNTKLFKKASTFDIN